MRFGGVAWAALTAGEGAGRGCGEECLRSKIAPFGCNTEGVKHARVQGGITAPAAEPSEPKKRPKPEKERVGEGSLEESRYLPGESNFLRVNEAASAFKDSALAFIPAKFSGFQVSASTVVRLERKKRVLVRNKVKRELNFSATWPLRCHAASPQKRENGSDQLRPRTPEVPAVTCRCPELDRWVRTAASAHERPERSRFRLDKRNQIKICPVPVSDSAEYKVAQTLKVDGETRYCYPEH